MSGARQALGAVYATATEHQVHEHHHPDRGAAYVAKFYDETQIKEPAVVSKLYPFSASNLPAQRETRLVVQVEAPQGANEHLGLLRRAARQPARSPASPAHSPAHYARPVATIMSYEDGWPHP